MDHMTTSLYTDQRLLAVLFIGGILVIGLTMTGQDTSESECPPVISLTFDDGYESVYTKAAPMLDQQNVTATTYPVTSHIGDTFENRSTMTWAQLQDLEERGWEIGSHTRTHPDLRTLNESELDEEINGSYQDLTAHGLEPATLAAPYGQYDERVRDAVMERYDGFRITEWGTNNRSAPAPSQLSAYWPYDNTTWQDIRAQLDQDLNDGRWAIIMLHTVSNGSTYDYNIDPATLQSILTYAETRDIHIKPVADVLDEGC